MKVFKFGGGVLNSASNIKKAADIVLNTNDKLIIVVSAMGKTTNLLEKITEHFYKGKQTSQLLEQLISFHKQIIYDLFEQESFYEFDLLTKKLEDTLLTNPSLNFGFEYDKIVSYGEMLSSLIFSEYLKHIGLNPKNTDIRKILKTDNNYTAANIFFEETLKNALETFDFSDTNLYVTQGFVGADKNNHTTTLGREGSDYTAAILASVFEADITIWKDVEGVFNADPKIIQNAIKFDALSFEETVELTYFGAKVLHLRTIFPLKQKNLKLTVKSFLKPETKGTEIKNFDSPAQPPVPAIIFKQNQILLNIKSPDTDFITEKFLGRIFSLLHYYNAKVNLIFNSALIFSVVIDNSMTLNELTTELKKYFKIEVTKNLTLITIRRYTECILSQIEKTSEIVYRRKNTENAFYLCKKTGNYKKINFDCN